MKISGFLKTAKKSLQALTQPNLVYWQDRFNKYGGRAVLDLRHPSSEMNSITTRQKKQIFPLLQERLSGQEEAALDFGCGPGRFSIELATMIQGSTIAIDPIQDFLDIAPHSEKVIYRVLKGSKVPLGDDFVDLVWICLVLGGIPNKKLYAIVAEIKRVMKPNSLLCLVENTSELKSGKYWHYRSVKFYQELFSFCHLEHLGDYTDFEETNSILIGRYEK